ncbi:replication factor C small subunit [Candidatus Micrarchaeota archaeon CG_4_10_14_0_2_um_filter_55_9]|nr:MAG: Replication factor C small subunit [Candidatus Micrarchaeota archaeon CG1_02_55_41]PIO03860.1 MAG: replication factor C small subunit [Candidatus Micrarchaeota archaeon CG09_land_8_20_14_0_10_55_25]PIZ91582.1 MAG: replication factor C small subunit [Candidatus Micrarchaeota archaeon CG_4_10_14_0_2_um_filter_55_9]PJD00989.1 MAG: replication factor C small subunit [Candidatus Micrarchaeota archaeon CG10_big_fil_rev_8_21_14_0_10_54_18]
MTEFVPWVEKYRPKRLNDIIGHEKVVANLKRYAADKSMPHLLFAGRAGIGKTCAALALANELYGDQRRQCFLELNASDERGIDVMRSREQQKDAARKANTTSVKDFARTRPMADVAFKIVFLDEADALTPDAQHALRRTMELYSSTTRFILSCNYSSKIIEPIQSRCAVFRFKALTDEDVKKIIERIIKGEGLEIADDEAMDALIYVADGDARRVINSLQAVATLTKKITAENIYSVASRARPKEVRAMVEAAFKGDFMKAREALDDLMIRYGLSGNDLLKQIYREVTSLDVPDDKKVFLVDRVGEYDFRMSEGANERIQLEALLAQIMLAGRS